MTDRTVILNPPAGHRGRQALACHRIDKAYDHLVDSAAEFDAIGNLIYVSWALEGIAAILAARGAFEQSSVLCAGRDAFLERQTSALPLNLQDGRLQLGSVDQQRRE